MGTTVNHRAEDETISTVLGWNVRERAKLTYRLLLSLEDTSGDEAALSREDINRQHCFSADSEAVARPVCLVHFKQATQP